MLNFEPTIMLNLALSIFSPVYVVNGQRLAQLEVAYLWFSPYLFIQEISVAPLSNKARSLVIWCMVWNRNSKFMVLILLMYTTFDWCPVLSTTIRFGPLKNPFGQLRHQSSHLFPLPTFHAASSSSRCPYCQLLNVLLCLPSPWPHFLTGWLRHVREVGNSLNNLSFYLSPGNFVSSVPVYCIGNTVLQPFACHRTLDHFLPGCALHRRP